MKGPTNNVSLALSGSGFKFPVHVGVLSSVERLGKEVVEIAGSSGGALIGGLYACGLSTDDLYKFSMNTKWTKYLTPSVKAVRRGGFLSLDAFTKDLKAMTGGKTFGELDSSIDLVITASDLLSHTPVEFSRAASPDVPVYLAIRASIAIPVVFTPVRIDGLMLTDGALFNYLPINLLRRDDAVKSGMKVTYRGLFKEGHMRWPWQTGVQSAYGALDRGNSWAVSHYAESRGIRISHMQTGFVNGLDPFMPLETRMRLFDVGRQAFLLDSE